MTDVVLGLDVGTSYMKCVGLREDGSMVAVQRIASPSAGAGDVVDAFEWWRTVETLLSTSVSALAAKELRPLSLCISGITPMLTLFDATDPDHAIAIPYWSLAVVEEGSTPEQCDRELTERRLAYLRKRSREQRLAQPRITDIVGYLNFRLSGELTVNTVALCEMGVLGSWGEETLLSVGGQPSPRVVAPAQQIGQIECLGFPRLRKLHGVALDGGCPDTLASIIGAGLSHASEWMLYLGTFGSLLQIGVEVSRLLSASQMAEHPFKWILSVPGLGPQIESVSAKWFPSHVQSDSLRRLDAAAAAAEPGAHGNLYLMPRWKDGMKTVGDFIFLQQTGEACGLKEQARALLEGLGYAASAIADPRPARVRASGGGARSRIWCEILSHASGIEIETCEDSWEATGTAEIAARSVWGLLQRRFPTRVDLPAPAMRVVDNRERVKALYRDQGWL